MKFILVRSYYFSKREEAEAYSKVKGSNVFQFVWKYIIYRFGFPKVTVMDNGSQFINFKFNDFCLKWEINIRYSMPRHPQGNGLTKVTNETKEMSQA